MKQKKETHAQSHCEHSVAIARLSNCTSDAITTQTSFARNDRRSAFTLAEVLITLAIIGVVAAMTIPTLIANYQKKNFTSAIKTTYSTLSRGMQLLMVQNNCFDDIECTGVFYGDTSVTTTEADWNKNFFAKMETVFKMAERCDNTNDNCKMLGKVKYLSGDNVIDFDTMHYAGFVLENGVLVLFNNAKTEFEYNSQIKKLISYIVIDVNGIKGPNQAGRDVFQLMLAQNGKIYAETSVELEKAKHGDEWKTSPDYWQNAPHQCGKPDGTIPENTAGTNCIARIMEENWEMRY